MKATEAVQLALTTTRDLVNWYLGDLSDADLFLRPVPGANHIAWQIGHLINADIGLLREELPDNPYPELPAGFAEKHDNKNAKDDSPHGFLTKAAYLDLFAKARGAAITALGKLS